MNVYLYTAALVIAGLATAFGTPLICRLATHLGVIDELGEERRVHTVPTPRIGGVAVFFGFAFALFAVLGVALTHAHGFLPADPGESLRQQLRDQLEDAHNLVGLLFGSMLILAVGLWDDVMKMRPRNKLLAQIVVALISMIYGFHIGSIHNPFTRDPLAYIDFPWYVGYPLTMLWYLGMMNAINLLDGLDGLLAGVTAISCVFLFAAAIVHHNPIVALVVIALAGSSLGFLPYNFNPARIFLGDAGSLFIGYVFATVSIIGASKTAIAINLLVPLVVLGLPILDTMAAIIRRTRSGKRITEADRGHFHHQLIFRYGLNVRQAVLLIYVVSAILGTAALLLGGGFRLPLGLAVP